MPERRIPSESSRKPTVSYDDQWVAWVDDRNEKEWASVTLAGFGVVASSLPVRVVRPGRASR